MVLDVRRAPPSAGRAGAALSRPDSARADWRAHPEEDDGPARPPPEDGGLRAEVPSRERPPTGVPSVPGQRPAASQADGQMPEVLLREQQPPAGVPPGPRPAASQTEGQAPEVLTREAPPAAAQNDGPEAAARLREWRPTGAAQPATGQPPVASQAVGPQAQVVSQGRPVTGTRSLTG